MMAAVSVERKQSVESVGIVLLILVAWILWTGAQALHSALGDPGLAPGAGGAPLAAAQTWITGNATLIALALFLTGLAAFLVRMILAGSVLSQLYVYSEASAGRSHAGFTLHTLGFLLQLTLTCWVVRAMTGGHSSTAIGWLGLLLLLNALSLAYLYLCTAKGRERYVALDGLWKSACLSLLVGVALLVFEWLRELKVGEANPVTGEGLAAANVAVGACALLLLCGLDAIVQHRRPSGAKSGLVSLIVSLVILTCVIGFGVLVILAGR